MDDTQAPEAPLKVLILSGIAHAHGVLNHGQTVDADQVGAEILKGLERELERRAQPGRVNINPREAGEALLRSLLSAGKAEEITVEKPGENKATGPEENKGGTPPKGGKGGGK